MTGNYTWKENIKKVVCVIYFIMKMAFFKIFYLNDSFYFLNICKLSYQMLTIKGHA